MLLSVAAPIFLPSTGSMPDSKTFQTSIHIIKSHIQLRMISPGGIHASQQTGVGCPMEGACAPTPHPSEIFIDTSTSWGIGFVMDGKWLAWELIPGWKTDDRDIGWAEMVAVELGLCATIAAGIHSPHLISRSDNTGVIGAMRVSMSHNHQ